MSFRTILRLFLAGFVAVSGFAASSVRINEFVARNSDSLLDEDGQSSDWIEIYNAGTEPVNLDEWFLTDDPERPTMWEFPTTTLPAGGYLIVFASGKNRNTPNLHANFSLEETGEYLALVNREALVISEFSPGYPSQREDVSYGYDSAGGLVFFNTPTPGKPNTTGVIDFVGDTRFSADRGFYDTPFDLVITTVTPGATIRYTLNGTVPTATTGTVYTGPLRISGTTVIRAAAFKTGLQPSNVDTQTYIFLDDVIRQSPDGSPPPGWPSSWGANSVDYGMDPAVVNDPRYRDTIKNDLRSVPTFSIVMNLNDLFHASTGIYANPGQDGASWEKACSMELIHADGTDGFQIDAGIRIRGGYSRSTGNPKHAFRFFFNQQYGAGKLNYPLFGKNGADQFDKIDLRTFQNYSWSFGGDSKGVFLRDQFSRDTQLDMGHNAERGNFYHLYINGQYWGLYNTDERPEAAYGVTYFGGNREDYDTIKVAPDNGYNIYATDGDMDAWTELYRQAKAGLASNEAYQKLQGNNPDGSPNPDFPVLIDIPNLIDYMLVIIYGGNKDAPISNFLNNESPNNWFGIRNRRIEARMGFKFFSHDAEHTLLIDDLSIDRTGPFPAGDSAVGKSNPQYIWKQLTANPEFRLKVADHIQRHFFNGGALTPAANTARFLKRKAEIDRAVVGESARWGDAQRSTPLTRDDAWIPAINGIVNNYFPTRSDRVLNQLKADNLYPNVAAVTFNRQSGSVDPGFSLTMSAPAGTIYYTLDGTDPRLLGGNISSKAIRYTGAVPLNENANVRARVLSGTTWSALSEADFTIIQTFKELMITELMYNPLPEANIDGDEFEFIELKNIGSQTLDLSGIHFTNGVDYVFPNGTRLAPGAFYLLVGNPTNFAARYPGVRIDGVFTNNFANSGEAVALIHAAGAPIAQFTYDDNDPWPATADGAGFSLVPATYSTNFDYALAGNWRASSRSGGSPGADDPPVNTPPVVVNEVLTHTDLPQLDQIELFNPTTAAADISGWFLTDSLNNPKKFRIPNGTSVPAGGFVVFSENQFNRTPGVDPNFTLSSHGEEVFLFSATADGTLTGYSQGFQFRGAANGVSFGRYTNSVAEVLYPAQKALTFGAPNAGPQVGPVIINEVQFHPAPGGYEFIELKNITGTAVKLFDPANPANTWKIDGASFTFPQGVEIPPNGLIVVSGVEPSVFRQHAGLPQDVKVYGPFSGNLQDGGELIEVLRPDAPDIENGVTVVPYIVVDSLRYGALAPWPPNSSGTGASIEKTVTSNFGNDPAVWRSSPIPASPGLDNDGNRIPLVNAGPNLALVSGTFPVSTNVTGSATDDGLPNPPNALTYQWSQVSGPGVVQFANANSATANVSFPGVGLYVLKLTVSDSELSVSDEMQVTISRPPEGIIVPRNSVWKYLDNGTDQGTAWRAPNFADASWKSGRGILGYGEPPTDTVINGGPSNDRFVTSYFRHAFDVASPRNVVSLKLGLVRDDGAIVYLNGTELLRSNMPFDNVGYRTYASGVVGGGEETTYFQFDIDPSRLVEGRNVFAVEVHQANAGSSDVDFDLELIGVVNLANEPPVASAGPDLTVPFPNAATLNGTAEDDGLPKTPGVFNANWSIVSGPGSVTFADGRVPKTSATFSIGGIYLLRFTVTDGELTTSDDVQVTVVGGDPYSAWREQNFTAAELADPLVSGDDADPDGDTCTNEHEFVAGTNPKDKTSYLHVSEVAVEDNDLVIGFDGVGDKSYSILGRDAFDGAVGWERILDLSPQGSSQRIEVLDKMNVERKKRFYRIVTPQLNPL